MNYLMKLLNFLRKVYNLPGFATVIDAAIMEYLKGRALSTHNKVDDKLIQILGAALDNKNYRAVMNGKGKYAKILKKVTKA